MARDVVLRAVLDARAAQHALECTIKQHDAGASAPGAPRGGTPGQSASPGGGDAIAP